jgi:predicted alpha/beta-hydrolase family hydrolase
MGTDNLPDSPQDLPVAMMADTLAIAVGDDKITGLVYRANLRTNPPTSLILGHGAGAGQASGFMTVFAYGLAARGLDVFTFNFLYMEQGRKTPDRQERLVDTYRAVVRTVREQPDFATHRLLIGGKSLGGRIASHLASEGLDDLGGLVFLGYPLHPPGKAFQARSEHLASIRAPMLFIQGSRDAFGSPDELREIINRDRLNGEVFAIENGDHSFKVSGKTALEQQAIYEVAQDTIASWLEKVK